MKVLTMRFRRVEQQLEHAGRGQRERELQDAGQDRPVEHVQFFGSRIGHVLSPFP